MNAAIVRPASTMIRPMVKAFTGLFRGTITVIAPFLILMCLP